MFLIVLLGKYSRCKGQNDIVNDTSRSVKQLVKTHLPASDQPDIAVFLAHVTSLFIK